MSIELPARRGTGRVQAYRGMPRLNSMRSEDPTPEALIRGWPATCGGQILLGGRRPDEGRSSYRADITGLAAYRQHDLDGLRLHAQQQKR